MTTSSVGATGSSTTGGTSTSSTPANTIGSQDAFLQLLVTQMQNQDPLNPMDSAQITSQLAEISTVTGVNNLNTTMQQLVASNNTSQMLSASSLIGQTVLVPGNAVPLSSSGQAVFGINLPSAADSVQVTIKDASGNVVHTMNLGSQAAGVDALAWDGSTDAGGTAAAGNYTVSVAATVGGAAVAATTLQSGSVIGVIQGANGPQLNLGAQGNVAVSSVAQVL